MDERDGLLNIQCGYSVSYATKDYGLINKYFGTLGYRSGNFNIFSMGGANQAGIFCTTKLAHIFEPRPPRGGLKYKTYKLVSVSQEHN